jgi:hypothetical protein
MSYTQKDILAVLDESARKFAFPAFDNMNYYLGTARINGFRDEQRWALIIQEVCWWPAADGIMLNVSAYGNCLSEKTLAFPGQARWDQGMIYWPHSPIECEFDDQGELRFDALRIRGQAVVLDPHQVPPQPAVPERGFAILVHLLETFREQLLCTAEELARVVPHNLPDLLCLDNWKHPDICRGELPSHNESLCNLAEVLASGDLSQLRAAAHPNVDWRLWMER